MNVKSEDVHFFSESCWRFGERCAVVEQRLRLGASSIEHDQVVAVLLQVRRHAAAHDA